MKKKTNQPKLSKKVVQQKIAARFTQTYRDLEYADIPTLQSFIKSKEGIRVKGEITEPFRLSSTDQMAIYRLMSDKKKFEQTVAKND